MREGKLRPGCNVCAKNKKLVAEGTTHFGHSTQRNQAGLDLFPEEWLPECWKVLGKLAMEGYNQWS